MPIDGTDAEKPGKSEVHMDSDHQKAYEKWKKKILEPALAKHPERREEFITTSSQKVDRLYTPLDTAHIDFPRDISYPGEFPYTRGIHSTMYRGRLWTMRMFAGFGSAGETNERFKYLLKQGQTGLSTAFDLPTLYGYDSDSPFAAGEFGECGVGVSSLEDMSILFKDIPLDKVTTSMTINSPAAMIWAMYIANAENQGVPKSKLGGTIQNDILKEYIAQKEYIFPPHPSMRLVTDTVEYGAKNMPRWNTISISGYHIREAGSTAVQELAFTLADGYAYADWAIERGLNVDEFAPRFSFFFNAHNDFFEEIAKYRAARRIWAKDMRYKYGAKDPRSWTLRFHTQTAGCSLTAQQPEINIVRVAIQAMAGVMGGTQSLHTDSMDEALALPSEKAVQIALRTQQVIAHESGVANVVDPLGGSYYLEWLTDDMERQTRDYFDRIDSLGGVVPAIEKGFFQKEIAAASYKYQKEIDNKERVVVGVNEYTSDESVEIPILEMDPEGFDRQCTRLKKLRASRDKYKFEASIRAIEKAAEGDDNLMPHFIEAAKAKVTLGEMCDVLRGVFGEYREGSDF